MEAHDILKQKNARLDSDLVLERARTFKLTAAVREVQTMGGAVLSLLKPMEREKNIDIDPSWVLAFDRRQPPDSPLRASHSVAPGASEKKV